MIFLELFSLRFDSNKINLILSDVLEAIYWRQIWIERKMENNARDEHKNTKKTMRNNNKIKYNAQVQV